MFLYNLPFFKNPFTILQNLRYLLLIYSNTGRLIVVEKFTVKKQEISNVSIFGCFIIQINKPYILSKYLSAGKKVGDELHFVNLKKHKM